MRSLPSTATEMPCDAAKLPAQCFQSALAAIAAWQLAPDQPVKCPVCQALALSVVDRSARPYTAWFALRCENCGLADTVTYALGGTGNSWS